jgi:acetyl-CoA acetyltransferase
MPTYVAGAAMTPFGRRGIGLRELTERAVAGALRDASIEPGDVQQVFFGNAAAGLLQGQEMIRGQVLLRDTGVLGAPVINVENACASSSTAFFLACQAVSTGEIDIALAVGAEELAIPDKKRSFGALAAATDLERDPEMRALVHELALGILQEQTLPESSPLMVHYAAKGRAYLAESGGTEADLALVVVKSRAFGALNPDAHLVTPTSVEEVLSSKMIEPPLHRPMCAPLSNGAAAIVVMSEQAARRLGSMQIRVRASALVSNNPAEDLSPTARAAERAYAAAGVDPPDVDLAEVHDAAAPAELILIEELGLAPRGDAVKMLRAGETAPGGRLPVNTSGGLLSRGHPIGATGAAQLVELADQLRGRSGPRQVPNARLGLAHNGGGVFAGDEAAVAVTILERAT